MAPVTNIRYAQLYQILSFIKLIYILSCDLNVDHTRSQSILNIIIRRTTLGTCRIHTLRARRMARLDDDDDNVVDDDDDHNTDDDDNTDDDVDDDVESTANGKIHIFSINIFFLNFE